MELTKKHLLELHNLAVLAAKKAGDVINNYDRSKLQVNIKKGASSKASEVVTEVDLLSQNAILEALLPSIKKYDLALLTEETTDDFSRFEKDFFWCIDPIDGTLSFVEGKPGFSVSIALVSKTGEAYIGVVFDPIKKTTYSAIKGKGAKKNGEFWSVSSSLNKHLSFTFDRSFRECSDFDKVIGLLQNYTSKHGIESLHASQQGGAVINAIWVAENSPACYFKFPKPKGGSIWDYAATACIFKELGLPVSDLFGNAMDLNSSESTFMNHKGILFATSNEIADFVKTIQTRLKL